MASRRIVVAVAALGLACAHDPARERIESAPESAAYGRDSKVSVTITQSSFGSALIWSIRRGEIRMYPRNEKGMSFQRTVGQSSWDDLTSIVDAIDPKAIAPRFENVNVLDGFQDYVEIRQSNGRKIETSLLNAVPSSLVPIYAWIEAQIPRASCEHCVIRSPGEPPVFEDPSRQ